MYHEANTEETDQDTSHEQPFVPPENQDDGTGDDSEECKRKSLGLTEVVLVSLRPVLDDICKSAISKTIQARV